MAFGVKFKIEGVDHLLARLDLAKRSVRNKWLRRGIVKATRLIVKSAKAKLRPRKDADGKTLEREGLLKKSLGARVEVNEARKRLYGIVGPRNGMAAQIGTRKRKGKKSNVGDPITEDPAKIAHLVEYGHGGPHPAPPHPFLRPAWDENKAAVQAIIADELTKGIGQIARAGK